MSQTDPDLKVVAIILTICLQVIEKSNNYGCWCVFDSYDWEFQKSPSIPTTTISSGRLVAPRGVDLGRLGLGGNFYLLLCVYDVFIMCCYVISCLSLCVYYVLFVCYHVVDYCVVLLCVCYLSLFVYCSFISLLVCHLFAACVITKLLCIYIYIYIHTYS